MHLHTAQETEAIELFTPADCLQQCLFEVQQMAAVAKWLLLSCRRCKPRCEVAGPPPEGYLATCRLHRVCGSIAMSHNRKLVPRAD